VAAAAAAVAADDGTRQLERAFDRLQLDPPSTVAEAAETVVAGLDDAVAALRELVVWPRLYAAVRPSSVSLCKSIARGVHQAIWVGLPSGPRAYGHGVGNQRAEEASQGRERFVTSVLKAVS
jgi:hypothetical protein